MPEFLPPFLLYLAGAAVVPLLTGRARQIFALLVPAIALANLYRIPEGIHYQQAFLEFELVLLRADSWSFVFAHIFTLVSFAGILFIVKENRRLDLSAGLLYAGSALGAVMAGDLLTLFFFWEMLTLGAILCLLARRTPASGRAAYRYLLVHVAGGVILLAGLAIHLGSGGSLAFDRIDLAGPGPVLMFLGFGVNCAWPLIGAWLPDTYPEASIGGVVFMAAFTTKTAVYALARVFPGEEPLVWIGLAMATLPIFYAVIANDLRRVLSYSLINQAGFMVAGIGLGTHLALNGTAAHAYCHILYKALLFMSIGAVIYRTGKSKATELGGLYRSMPLTCVFCCIGALSMAAPLFGGFVSKSMIVSAAAKQGESLLWLGLLFAAAGTFLHTAIKVPFFAFFGRDSGVRCKEAPLNQLIAMGFIAVLCVVVGTFPQGTLYQLLPYEDATYHPYTVGHVTDQLALLLFSGLAFTLMIRAGWYPAEIRARHLDAEWFYRRGGPLFFRAMDRLLNGINKAAATFLSSAISPRVGIFFDTGAYRIACWAMTPVWFLRGLNAERREEERQSLFRKSQRGAYPIGLTAFFAVVFLALLAALLAY